MERWGGGVLSFLSPISLFAISLFSLPFYGKKINLGPGPAV